MIPQRKYIKVLLLLSAWTVVTYVLFKLQIDFTNYLVVHQNKIIHFNTSHIKFDNIYWQTLDTPNGPFKLFNAYYDDRKGSRIGPSIRIIALINRTELQNDTTFCQFWFNGRKKPIVSEEIIFDLMGYKGNGWYEHYMPFVIRCPYNFTEYQEIPEGISLMTKNVTQVVNYLKISNVRPEINGGMKKPFAVCVKDLNFTVEAENSAIRLVEWIELIRILGADKIFIYYYHVTRNIHKVFRYYERSGILEIVKMSLPKVVDSSWATQLISLNDCLYRNLYLYDYLAVIDTDEIIMPRYPEDMSWIDLLERIKHNQTDYNRNYGSYNFRNIYFSDDIQHIYNMHTDVPQYLHLLQHILRPMNHSDPGQSIKSFHSTEFVECVHNHYPLACFDWCSNFEVNIEFAHNAHYRQACPNELGKVVCNYYKTHTVVDKTVWKYKDEFLKQTTKAIKILQLIKDDK